MSFQEICIVGNVGRDCELSYTPSAIAVAKFTVAVTKKIGKGEGQREITTWFRCTLWREKAESLVNFIHKGNKIMLWGEVSANAFIAKDGKPAASIDVQVSRVQFLEKREQEHSNGHQPESQRQTADIPF